MKQEQKLKKIEVNQEVYNKLFLPPDKSFSEGLLIDQYNGQQRRMLNVFKAVAQDSISAPVITHRSMGYILMSFLRYKTAGKGRFKLLAEWAEQEHGIPIEVSTTLCLLGIEAANIHEEDKLIKVAKKHIRNRKPRK